MLSPTALRTYGIYFLDMAGYLLPVHGIVLERRATAGCGKQHVTGQSTTATMTSSNTDRQYLIHLPGSYDVNSPMPVIISYHGNTQSMYAQETLTRFSDESVNPDMITVYPQGLGNSWQGASYHDAGLPSDKVFTIDLVNHLKVEYCIDDSRIYANGMSNGGGFVNTLACSPGHGGDFAAFAPVSGAFYDDDVDLGKTSCQPARSPLPILEFHGSADGTIPYDGRGNVGHGSLPSIPNWLASWAVLDGCSQPPQASDQPFDGYDYVSYSCGNLPNIVSHYKVTDLGHTWPDTSNSPIDASSLIIEFFKANCKA